MNSKTEAGGDASIVISSESERGAKRGEEPVYIG